MAAEQPPPRAAPQPLPPVGVVPHPPRGVGQQPAAAAERQPQLAGAQGQQSTVGQQRIAAAEPPIPAASGQNSAAAGRAGETKADQTVSLIEARRYIGTQVYNGQGDELGEVKRVLPGEGDRAGKIVLEFGGIFGGLLGIGQKQVALNWQQFDLDPAKDRLILHMTEDQLKQLPEYKG
jgi:PRC-barrel domain